MAKSHPHKEANFLVRHKTVRDKPLTYSTGLCLIGSFSGIQRIAMQRSSIITATTCLSWAAALFLAGCVFDLSYVKLRPVTFTPVSGATQADFSLREEVKATMGTGYPTRLKSGTRWHQIGRTEFGPVFTTQDQVVTVEASNIYEARPVVSDQSLIGFYLPVEQKFVSVGRPIRLETQPVHLNPR